MHIGMIGGIGPAATEFYYHHLVDRFRMAGNKMELTIVHADVNELMSNFTSGSPEKQAATYFELAQRLERAGADCVVISSISGHFCMPEFESISPLPIISILPAINEEFRSRKLNKVGLLGTSVTMDSRLFGGIDSAELVLPPGNDKDRVNDTYLALATSGQATEEQRRFLFEVGMGLVTQQGADAVLLAGTDLCLAFDGHNCGFPVIDGALVHIGSIVQQSLSASSPAEPEKIA